MTRRVVVAPDKFKGCLPAAGVAAALAAGLRAGGVEDVVELPVADGGDGTVDALVRHGWDVLPVRVTGPEGTPVDALVAVRGDTAVVESALTSGLDLLRGAPLRPLAAGSRGVGEAVAAAVDHGARHVVIGVGGTACTDGGAGLLQALGARVTAGDGSPVVDGGGALLDVAAVDLGPVRQRLAGVRVTVATDVDNPLLGPAGAAAVYGPQKGADPAQVAVLDDALRRFASLVAPAQVDRPGAGAGGGIGFAALACLGGTLRPGIDLVLDLLGADALLAGTDLVVTGEGRFDEQSLRGKAPVGVLAAAARRGVPVAVVCGLDDLGADRATAAGFADVVALARLGTGPQDALDRAPELLVRAGRLLAERLAPGRTDGVAAGPA